MDCAPEAGGRWARHGARQLEALLEGHFGTRKLAIREEDDIEQKVQEIVERDLGDFSWSLCFRPEFLRRLYCHGFLPICNEVGGDPSDPLFVLLPKLHRKRSVLRMPARLHVDRGARKRSKKYRVAVDTALGQVVDGCIGQHGESWLYPPIRTSLAAVHQRQAEAAGVEAGAEAAGTEAAPTATVHSVELWSEDGRLVAGELGVRCGAMYTSLTGFFSEGGAGTVQMLALGGLLLQGGFRCWDLGMPLAYKDGLGAQEVGRAEFVELQRALRSDSSARLRAPGGVSAAELLVEVVRAGMEGDITPTAKRMAAEPATVGAILPQSCGVEVARAA